MICRARLLYKPKCLEDGLSRKEGAASGQEHPDHQDFRDQMPLKVHDCVDLNPQQPKAGDHQGDPHHETKQTAHFLTFESYCTLYGHFFLKGENS